MTRDSKRFLPPEAVARISRLDLKAREIVEGFLSGMHRSPYFGQSVEFVQHREYTVGDDPRRIDWKAWSKTDKYYIKQYEEDTNLRTTLLLDASESMAYGSGEVSKFEYGCTIAMCLAYLLLKQQDSVGMVTFDQEIRKTVPFSSRRNHLLNLLAALDTELPTKKSDLLPLLSRIANDQKQRGMIVVISDLFADRAGLFKGLKLLRHRGHDVLVMHILDDAELDFPFSGSTRFEGLEDAGQLLCDPRALREGYLQAMQSFLSEVRKQCAGHLVDYQVIRTSENPDAVLAYFLNHRLGLKSSGRR
ncbi:MAG: DUF58 domain-containing protein [Planctomycetales bacterium]